MRDLSSSALRLHGMRASAVTGYKSGKRQMYEKARNRCWRYLEIARYHFTTDRSHSYTLVWSRLLYRLSDDFEQKSRGMRRILKVMYRGGRYWCNFTYVLDRLWNKLNDSWRLLSQIGSHVQAHHQVLPTLMVCC